MACFQWRPRKRRAAARALSYASMSESFGGQSRFPAFQKGISQYAALSGIFQGFLRKHFTFRTLAHGYPFVQ
jgi:hypothetical protein